MSVSALVDQILQKYYSEEQIEKNKNNKFSFDICPADRRALGSFIISLRDYFKNENDHNAFKEIISLLGGIITHDWSDSNSFCVGFKNDDIDKEILSKLFMIEAFESDLLLHYC